MIASLKKWMFNKALKEHQNYTKKTPFAGVNLCKTICIVADGDSESSRQSTQIYIKKLQSLGKVVDFVFFHGDKEEREKAYNKKDINWKGIPENEWVDSLLDKEYDLLIYLYPRLESHLKYFATLCNAKFKIGPGFSEEDQIFDLMIDIENFSDTDMLVKNIDKQLSLLSN